jgi:MerR family redox-sensitive transcriptional activator SoxR
MSISQVAREFGIRASALRYYEQIGILPSPERVSGQRRYDRTTLYRLAIIQRARQTGFSLTEIRALFFGFRAQTPISARWKKLSRKKLSELTAIIQQIRTMQRLLLQIQKCHCRAIEQCGRAMLERQCRETSSGALRRPSKQLRVDVTRKAVSFAPDYGSRRGTSKV